MTSFLPRWREDSPIREAAWIARCVGDPTTTPLTEADLTALASYLRQLEFERGAPVFRAGERPEGVWIVRSGMIELATGAGRRKLVVQMLYPGSVDGDIPLILGMPFPYSARATETSRCLFLTSESFESLLREHPTVARRWLSSVAARVSRGQERLHLGLTRQVHEDGSDHSGQNSSKYGVHLSSYGLARRPGPLSLVGTHSHGGAFPNCLVQDKAHLVEWFNCGHG